MSRRRILHKHAVAEQSLEAIAEHLATAAGVRVALRFLDRAEETFAQILRSPRIGHPQELHSLALGAVRAWQVAGFRKWRVYYREVAGGVEVLDVMHSARDQEARLQERFEDESS